MTNAFRNPVAALAIALAVAGAWWLGANTGREPAAPPPAAAEDDVLYWYDPMRPEVHFDAPGRSPFMEMDLVAKRRTEDNDDGGVTISPRVVQNLGVRTAAAGVATIAPAATVTGTVAVDERRIAVVSARADGWIERLDVRSTGVAVVRGQVLAGMYSPRILAAQEEYLLAARAGDATLADAARRRLVLLGMGAAQLARIDGAAAERRLDVVAPIGGIVTALDVRPGAAVATGAPLMSIADLGEIWVFAEVPEVHSAWLEAGQPATVTPAGGGAASIDGRLDYLYPALTAATRTVRARIALANPAGRLRPGMTARVTLRGAPREALVVPTESLIRSGERTALIVAEGGGRFRPAAVAAGLEEGELTEITSGLRAGEVVVVSGQFLIDSEANLRGALDRLAPGQAP